MRFAALVETRDEMITNATKILVEKSAALDIIIKYWIGKYFVV